MENIPVPIKTIDNKKFLSDKIKRAKLSPTRTLELCRNYVSEKKGEWNHYDWLNFVKEMNEQGYNNHPDELGFILESEKKKYFTNKQEFIKPELRLAKPVPKQNIIKQTIPYNSKKHQDVLLQKLTAFPVMRLFRGKLVYQNKSLFDRIKIKKQ
ncbi:hypothetical protein JXB41_01020 [Candidatus Woesearchaeota archaeon]|nr:hypothetical protein [Candidatus Woesearchaeota archaeon]